MTTTTTTDTLLNIESLVHSTHSRLNTLQSQLKQHRQMLDSLLENDSEYSQLATEAQKTAKLKKIAQAKVHRQPEAMRLLDEIHHSQSQVRELKTALSDYLTQYLASSGSRQIETPAGELLEIIYTARLTKAK